MWTAIAPILAITIVMGIKIKNAGILTNPKLSGTSILRYVPEIAKPKAPIIDTMKPIAAELPIALLIEYPKNFNIGIVQVLTHQPDRITKRHTTGKQLT